MEFGIFNSLYTPRQAYEGVDDQWAVETQRLHDEIAWTIAADKAGFKYSWVTEHHFLTEYSHLSANEVFLGYLAAATSRIHLGSGIFNDLQSAVAARHPEVAVNNTLVGGVEALRPIPVDQVAQLEYLSAWEAGNRYGMTFRDGILLVQIGDSPGSQLSLAR